MQIYMKKISIQTTRNVQLINITNDIRKIVKESKIQRGFTIVFTLHTTSGLMINENEPGLEKDFEEMLKELFSETDHNRFHHHYHEKDGRMAVNAWAHFRSAVIGSNLIIPVDNNDLVLGGRQNIYFVEMDGPMYRTFVIQVVGT